MLILGAVGTFVTGWLLPRLAEFRAAHPFVNLRQERLIQPFAIEVTRGAYWLTGPKSRTETRAMQAFRNWLLDIVID